MNNYEYLVEYASECGAEVIELDLETTKPCGKCINNILIINKNMTLRDKFCVLSEELGHFKTTVGDITDQRNISNRKQELKARAWGYEIIIGLKGLVKAYYSGCCSKSDMAEFFNVTENFVEEAISYYTSKYGLSYKLDDYIITFSPCLNITKSA